MSVRNDRKARVAAQVAAFVAWKAERDRRVQNGDGEVQRARIERLLAVVGRWYAG